MKKQLRKAMICTVAMMLVAVVTLTGVTYAWFSKSDSAQVTDMTINVEARDGGVYISTDKYANFGTSIDIPVDANTKFNPASTAGTLDDNGKLKFFNGALESPMDDTLEITALTSPSGYYIEQEVYFDNSTGGGTLVVNLTDPTGIGIVTSTNSNRKIQAATRIAIVTHGSLTVDEFNTNKLTDAEYPIGTPTVQILETNPNEHTSTGINEYKILTGKTSVGASEVFSYYYGVNAVPASGAEINRYNKKLNVTDPDIAELTKLEHVEGSILKSDPANVEIKIPAYSYLKTIVYVWIEGQDPDCQNDVSGVPFTVNLNFTKARMEYAEEAGS